MNCEVCGRELQEDSRFCDFCGEKIPEKEQHPEEYKTVLASKPLLTGILISLGITVIIILIMSGLGFPFIFGGLFLPFFFIRRKK
jgi:membrane-bound ClpP family serine protease